MSNLKFSTPIGNDDDSDDEDVDIYVSPRHFVGRTPGPKATKQKIFDEQVSARHYLTSLSKQTYREDPKSEREGQAGIDHPVDEKSVKYTIDNEKTTKGTETKHEQASGNAFLCNIFFAVNYVLAVLSLYLLALSMWVLFGQRRQGVDAFIPIGGSLLRSVTAFGLCMMLASAIFLFNTFTALGKVGPGIAVGFQKDSDRKGFFHGQLLSLLAVLLLTIILFACFPPLSSISSSGVTPTTWRNMAASYPHSVCAFQVAKKCAGAVDHVCMSKNAQTSSASCPGHHCADSCRFVSRRAVVHVTACQNCVKLSSTTLLKRCRAVEAQKSTSRNCLAPLTRIVQRFYMTIIISTSVVMFFAVFAMLTGMFGFLHTV